ncbi:MAG: hypothetical protein AAB373_01455 [Patescibacteria group bacterium]
MADRFDRDRDIDTTEIPSRGTGDLAKLIFELKFIERAARDEIFSRISYFLERKLGGGGSECVFKILALLTDPEIDFVVQGGIVSVYVDKIRPRNYQFGARDDHSQAIIDLVSQLSGDGVEVINREEDEFGTEVIGFKMPLAELDRGFPIGGVPRGGVEVVDDFVGQGEVGDIRQRVGGAVALGGSVGKDVD